MQAGGGGAKGAAILESTSSRRANVNEGSEVGPLLADLHPASAKDRDLAHLIMDLVFSHELGVGGPRFLKFRHFF